MMKNMERQENIYGDPDFILLHDENTYQVRNIPDNYILTHL